jgi:hypothetical protein
MKAERPNGSVCLKVAAKILAKHGIDTDAKRIFAQLRELGLLDGARASDAALREGLLTEAAGSFRHGTGGDDVYVRTFITGRGITACMNRMKRVWAPDGEIELGVGECKLGF